MHGIRGELHLPSLPKPFGNWEGTTAQETVLGGIDVFTMPPCQSNTLVLIGIGREDQRQ
jgi:hypothetical protein